MRVRSVSRCWCWVGLALIGGMVTPVSAAAQTPGSPLTLNDAIQLALTNYPAIKESRARAQAGEEGVGLARTAYLPRLDMVWQENLITTNNVLGLLCAPSSKISCVPAPIVSRGGGIAVARNQVRQAVQIADMARASLTEAFREGSKVAVATPKAS